MQATARWMQHCHTAGGAQDPHGAPPSQGQRRAQLKLWPRAELQKAHCTRPTLTGHHKKTARSRGQAANHEVGPLRVQAMLTAWRKWPGGLLSARQGDGGMQGANFLRHFLLNTLEVNERILKLLGQARHVSRSVTAYCCCNT